jgi:uncharacterized protein
MPTYLAPDIYIQEVSGGARPIQAVGTSTAGFVGIAPDPKAHLNEVRAINNWSEFVREFVPRDITAGTPLSNAVYGFFLNGGSRCFVVNVGAGGQVKGTGNKRGGLDLLETIDEIAIVAIPGFTDAASYDATLSHCESLKDRVAILDAPGDVDDIDRLKTVATAPAPARGGSGGGGAAGGSEEGGGGSNSSGGVRPREPEKGYGTFYFPWVIVRDPLAADPAQAQVAVPPSGHIAGIWARNDAERGVHKAPANELVRGALGVTYALTRTEQGELNSAGVNCIRFFPREGIRVWGARTLTTSDREWQYLNVRRLFTMIEESIAGSTRWIVFEPNDPTLWKSIRRDISAFLTRLWRDGALMGATPEEAFFVKCDEETNPPEVIEAGTVVTEIGIAPVLPAEFIVFRISQRQSGAQVEA